MTIYYALLTVTPDGGQKDNFKKLGRLHAIRAFGDKMDKETWKGTDYEERVLFMGLVADKHVDVFGADRCNSKWPIRSLGMQYLKNKAQTWIFISADSWNEINCLVKFINGVLIVFLFLHYYNSRYKWLISIADDKPIKAKQPMP